MGCSYDEYRQRCPVEERVKTFEFSSVRKSMTVVINHTNEKGEKMYRVLTKGASEKLLDSCTYILDENENVSPSVNWTKPANIWDISYPISG